MKTTYTTGIIEWHDTLKEAMDAILIKYPAAVFFDESGYVVYEDSMPDEYVNVWENGKSSDADNDPIATISRFPLVY